MSIKKSIVNSEDKIALPLSWMWDEKDYDLSEKLKEIHSSMFEFYHYGYPEQHAGPISNSIRKEVDRFHRISEMDNKLDNITKEIEKHKLPSSDKEEI